MIMRNRKRNCLIANALWATFGAPVAYLSIDSVPVAAILIIVGFGAITSGFLFLE
jgi:hypothetical protein